MQTSGCLLSACEMSELEQRDNPPIEPVYRQASPGSPIEFGALKVSLADDADARAAYARLRFNPDDLLEIVIPATDTDTLAERTQHAFTPVRRATVTLHLLDYGTCVETFCIPASAERSVYRPKNSQIQVYPPTNSISSVTFHLLNWPDFFGPDSYVLRTGAPPLNGFKLCGRLVLQLDSWTITVAATEDTRSAVESLNESGGYIITHVGEIRRTNGDEFSTEELDRLLVPLSYLFSFTFGRWSGPDLSVGFDSSGNRVYGQWGLMRCASGPWRGSRSWFDSQHGEFLPALLPGFMKLWSNDVWHRPLTEAIYWYTSANRVGAGLGVDSALLFTQAAMELLSWTYCVLDRKMVSASAFKPRGLSAADKLRLLASSLGLPLEIPSPLTALHAKRGKKWDGSMDAITDLRNGLVHPGNDRKIPHNAYYDAWRLSQWYIELMILRLCSYSGKYANRLSQRYVGQVEPVPWVT